MYGVRLSFCLADWARLGEVYPPALRGLEAKADAALALLDQTREPARFHDFVAICRYLERPEEPVRRFLGYHAADRELAASIVRHIWDELGACAPSISPCRQKNTTSRWRSLIDPWR